MRSLHGSATNRPSDGVKWTTGKAGLTVILMDTAETAAAGGADIHGKIHARKGPLM
jgi:hypothetical protein